jgi:hypothetical protein
VIRWLPSRVEARNLPPAARTRAPGAALRLSLIFAACTIAAGVLDSFLPPTTPGTARALPSSACSPPTPVTRWHSP